MNTTSADRWMAIGILVSLLVVGGVFGAMLCQQSSACACGQSG